MGRFACIILIFSACTSLGWGQEMVFNFSNPSFIGGNSFNASWMLQEAQLQNQFTAPKSDYMSSYEDDPLGDFAAGLNRQILNQISRQLYSKIFDEDGLKEGEYNVGDYSINISEETDGVVIEIKDITNGNETRVVVPYF
ncbi:MAG: curli assembly protein CsgF [Bacteroidetes bacterium]|nr:curli assembly protein CsgF [Bacteroidota bacterium]